MGIPSKPNNIEAEEAVLGGLLIDSDYLSHLIGLLTPDDFFLQKHTYIYEAILQLNAKAIPVDILTLCDELERMGHYGNLSASSYLTELISRTPTATHTVHYAGIVKEMSDRRRLIDAAGQITRLAYDTNMPLRQVYSEAEDALYKAAPADQTNIKSLETLADEELDRQEEIMKSGQEPGLTTGLKDLDKIIGGMQKSDFILVAGHPGMGKTALVVNGFGMHVARDLKKGVGVISLEMSGNQLAQRILASESQVSAAKIRSGLKDDQDWLKFMEAVKKMKLPFWVDDTPAMTAAEIRAKAKRLKLEYGIEFLIVDYLQLIEAGIKTENENAKAAYVSRTLKWVARELDLPLAVISNLRKAADKGDKRPGMSDLYGSTALQYDAGLILFVHRDEVFNPDTEFPNIGEIIIPKNRFGATSVISTYFKKEVTLFVDLEVKANPLY